MGEKVSVGDVSELQFNILQYFFFNGFTYNTPIDFYQQANHIRRYDQILRFLQ
jgi:hypothetical protein